MLTRPFIVVDLPAWLRRSASFTVPARVPFMLCLCTGLPALNQLVAHARHVSCQTRDLKSPQSPMIITSACGHAKEGRKLLSSIPIFNQNDTTVCQRSPTNCRWASYPPVAPRHPPCCPVTQSRSSPGAGRCWAWRETCAPPLPRGWPRRLRGCTGRGAGGGGAGRARAGHRHWMVCAGLRSRRCSGRWGRVVVRCLRGPRGRCVRVTF